ncbi:Remorin [Morella rubra]|uniref:Remorin n=1 Tax=Morella rubra TaxID=262757 RepID=A0A6A1UXW7_9ROSI|nr:Remorin [Morella rubra]KAB1205241.1 Remorin [Morella rubra]
MEKKVKRVEAKTPSVTPLASVGVPSYVAGPPEPVVIVAVGEDRTPEILLTTGSKGSTDRDIALAEIEKEKRLTLIKAWEECKKAKIDNEAQKQLSAVAAWEYSKTASVEAKLRDIEAKLEKIKAAVREKMKNRVASIHKEAEERRAMIEARRRGKILRVEEMAAKYRATGNVPKKLFSCSEIPWCL